MERTFKTMIGATAVAGMLSLSGFSLPASLAGEPPPTAAQMQAIPSEGLEPGDSFVVSNLEGSECEGGEVTGDTGGIRPGQWVATMEVNGDWSVTIGIPENGPPTASGEDTPFPPGDYEIHAFCDLIVAPNGFGAGGQVQGFEYE
ncbi:MAG: hypothetical protein ACSLFP_15490, partial [Acidimicrobiales bacterium]